MTRTAQHRRLADEGGQVAVELALCLPVVLLFIFLVVDFGRVFNYLNDANHIAAASARFAAVNQDPRDRPELRGDTKELREGGKQVPRKLEICVSFPEGTDVGDPVEVKTTAQFTLFGPINWLGSVLGGGTIGIHGEATMRLERKPTFAAGCWSHG